MPAAKRRTKQNKTAFWRRRATAEAPGLSGGGDHGLPKSEAVFGRMTGCRTADCSTAKRWHAVGGDGGELTLKAIKCIVKQRNEGRLVSRRRIDSVSVITWHQSIFIHTVSVNILCHRWQVLNRHKWLSVV